MKTTITCPTCGLEHGLFWRVSGPYKEDRQLSYRCNKVQKEVMTGGNFYRPEYHSFTKIMTVTDEAVIAQADPNLREEYTATYRKEVQDKQQQQLILMYRK